MAAACNDTLGQPKFPVSESPGVESAPLLPPRPILVHDKCRDESLSSIVWWRALFKRSLCTYTSGEITVMVNEKFCMRATRGGI